MIRRLTVFLVVLAVALGLLFLQNKVLVGEQELQAQLQRIDKDAASGGSHTYKVTFTDLGGNGVLATGEERDQVVKRLAGNERIEPIKGATVGEVTADHAIEVVVPAEVAEDQLKRRLQGASFKRANQPRSLFHLNKGIDISGGVEFICELRNDNGERVAADDEVMHVLRTRLDTRGLTEPVVTKLSNGDVQVVIPGGTEADAARTRKVLEDTGRLEFREILEDYRYVALGQPEQKVVSRPNGGYDFAPGVYHNRSDIVAPKRVDPGFTPDHFYRLGKAELTGRDVADAFQTLEQGQQAVAITFTATGSTRNEAFTTRLHATGPHGNNSGTGRLAILFDGVVQSDPIVESPSSAHCSIHGSFTQDEIDRLRTSLKAGSLAVKPQVLSERVVGATLGTETVSRAMTAMAASFVLIALFMAVYYRRLGTVANLCLVVTAVLIYATLSVFNATVTLPGLAGLVLTIGMAVDTNILVFERIREELREDKGLNYAIDHGYGRAFLTIVDAHLTTFITALILYYIGSGPVKGFGLTLMIGIVVNLFSGIYVGRLITDWLCRRSQALPMASWVPALRLPYVRWRHAGYAFSIITGVLGAGWFIFGHYIMHDSFERNFDIDFTGGNMVQVIYKEPKTLNAVEGAVQAAYAAKPQELNLLHELRLQPYVASIGDDASKSRQWVFRGRDEAGSALEAQRDEREAERVKLQRQANELRSQVPAKETEARAVDKQVEAVAKDLRDLQARIAARTEAFKRQIAAAFPGQIAAEGEELLGAVWQDNRLTLKLATLQPVDGEQTQRLAVVLAKQRDELAAVEAKPLAGSDPGFELTATYRQKPGAASSLEVTDPVLDRLAGLFTAAGVQGDLAKGEANAAFELYGAAVAQAGKERVTVAKPFPATEHFSGQVAGRMKVLALVAVVLSFVAILAYVAARFEFRFGIGAVVALVHDVILTVGVISMLGIRIDLTVIAAILTIIGYSINDTIVTFDRIRENLPKLGKSLAETIDISIAQTMSRTVLTSGTVILTVAILLAFGGESLHAFTATLLIGLILGTYSSVFVAAPLLMTFQKKGAPPTLVPSTPTGAEALADPATPVPGTPG